MAVTLEVTLSLHDIKLMLIFWQSIMEMNGSTVVAMLGKDCVAIASDTRFGVQQLTVDNQFDRIFKINDNCYVGMPGLATDVSTVVQKLKMRTNMYALREERDISPKVFTSLVSSLLYEHRFGYYFVEPIIAGLQGPEKTPFISNMDLIGATTTPSDFVVAGSCPEALFGICETYWKPNMEQEELFETVAQCLLCAQDRDCLAGWGAVVHIITPKGTIIRKLRARQD